ncbi:hypothetical protein EON65_14095, partial [archaeon]
MRRSLLRLPEPEVARLGVDIHKPIMAGSQEAYDLLIAWKSRQEELQEAMKKMIKPADHMRTLVLTFMSSTTTMSEKIALLVELEKMLGDIDNARDFYTMGYWPVLISALRSDNNDYESSHTENKARTSNNNKIRSLAAQCIGTAVKNSYDFQLWLIEDLRKTGG